MIVTFVFAGLTLIGYGIYAASQGEIQLFGRQYTGKSAKGCSVFLIVLGLLALLMVFALE